MRTGNRLFISGKFLNKLGNNYTANTCRSGMSTKLLNNTVEPLISWKSRDSISNVLCHSVPFKSPNEQDGATVEMESRDYQDMSGFTIVLKKCTVLSCSVRSLFGPTRKSSPWGHFFDGGLNQSIKRTLPLLLEPSAARRKHSKSTLLVKNLSVAECSMRQSYRNRTSDTRMLCDAGNVPIAPRSITMN